MDAGGSDTVEQIVAFIMHRGLFDFSAINAESIAEIASTLDLMVKGREVRNILADRTQCSQFELVRFL
jgi:hypothetical protein